VLAAGGTAAAEPGTDPHLEAGALVGVDGFGHRTGLGDSPDGTHPHTAPLLGVRLGVLALPRLPARHTLWAEGELTFAPAFTGGATPAYAPVLGWRAQLALRRLGGTIEPGLVAGAGGASLLARSPGIRRDTDAVLYWGASAAVSLGDGWFARLDVRHDLTAARDGGVGSGIEVIAAVTMRWGRRRKAESEERLPAADYRRPPEGRTMPEVVAPTVVGTTTPPVVTAPPVDVSHVDTRGVKLVIQDEEPPPSPPTTTPTTGTVATTPDTKDVSRALAAGSGLRFEAGRAKLSPRAKASLDALGDVLRRNTQLVLHIVGHPDNGDSDLARRRAEAVKWYLVDQGAAVDQITTSVGDPIPRGAVIELRAQ
jgi:hypothetical protein